MTTAMNPLTMQEMETGLVPVTYEEAGRMFKANGQKPFSFVTDPSQVLKTVVKTRDGVCAVPPSSLSLVNGRLL